MNEFISTLDSVFRHPAFVALVSVSFGTWLFGHFNYLRSQRDDRREKSITFIEETGKPINLVLAELIRHTRKRKAPSDDSLSKAVTALFYQRFAVAIKSEAFLKSTAFSKEYDKIIFDLSDIARRVAEPDAPYDALEKETSAAWQRTRTFLSQALSNALER